MDSLRFKHDSLNSTLIGVDVGSTVQFRGLPYGQVTRRFAEPESTAQFSSELDCTRYGPRCPQVPVDVGHLLRVPRDHVFPEEPEDEFRCLNLDVVVPKEFLGPSKRNLPVLIWIHGGSQAVTFGSAASGVCDMTTIVSDSSKMKKAIIAVSVQYRLNIFAFGSDTSPHNLALRDQRLALEWVQTHVAGFGGDANRVTVAGESAGAVYCHAHLVSKAPACQFILSSGSLYLSPPQPPEKASGMRQLLQKHLDEVNQTTLETAPVSSIIKALQQSGIQSWFLQKERALENWQLTTGNCERLLTSDVQHESVIWRSGIWSMDAVDIVKAFELAGSHSNKLKQDYNIDIDRPSSCKIGALDFINDYKFVVPLAKIWRQWRSEGKPVYQCLVDEYNPWQPSNGAHHAVDLILLFEGIRHSSPSAKATGQSMRSKWIEFVHGVEPWSSDLYAAFGPYGALQLLGDTDLNTRRRMAQVRHLESVEPGLLDQVFAALTVGRISLLN